MSSAAGERRIKVLHIIGDLQVGGAENSLLRLLQQTDAEAFHSRIAVLREAAPETSLASDYAALGVPIWQLRAGSLLGAILALLRLWVLVFRDRPDVIQGWMYYGGLVALIARLARPGRCAVAWNIRHSVADIGVEPRGLRATIRVAARLSRFPRAIVYNSNVSARQHEMIGFHSMPRHVIPNGFDLGLFEPSRAARSQLRNEIGVSEDTLVVGNVARFHPMKGHSLLLQAAAIVVRTLPEVRFLLIGRGADSRNTILAGEIHDLEIENIVHLLGQRRDVHTIMGGLDMLVVSSTYGEGFPNVLGEAMACEVPCIATDVGDAAWIVGQAGRIVPPGDPSALATAISALVNMGDEARHELGLLARRRVQSEFSLARMSERYAELYSELGRRRLRPSGR